MCRRGAFESWEGRRAICLDKGVDDIECNLCRVRIAVDCDGRQRSFVAERDALREAFRLPRKIPTEFQKNLPDDALVLARNGDNLRSAFAFRQRQHEGAAPE